MGKIRVKALGDEAQEKKQKLDTQKRKEQKKLESPPAKQDDEISVEVVNTEISGVEEKKEIKATKKDKFQKNKAHTRSKTYLEKSEKIDKNKLYTLTDALNVLPTVNFAKFDETVELHMNMSGSVSGAMTLPHGTGKQVRVALADGADAQSVEELVKKIEGGQIDFDVLIATPDAMPKLARVARVLGPRGLMPNPKNGTVTPKAQEAAKKFAGGQVNYKTEAKAPILHMIVGKMSFGDKKLKENITVAIQTVNTKNILNITLKSTMSPGLKLDIASV